MEEREEEALITFNNGTAKVSIKGDNMWLVRWYCDQEYIGEYELKPGMWGSYPLKLGNWRIEFWENHEKVSEFNNNLEGNSILIITDLNLENSLPGKQPTVNKLLSRANEIESKYNCEVVYYFKGSEKYDISPLKTLKMNDEYDFSLILEENYG